MKQFIKFATEIKNNFEQKMKEQDIKFKEVILMRHLGINNRVRVIDGYNNYAVTDNGEVYNIKKKQILKGNVNNFGYHRVNLCNKEGNKFLKTHRLVAKAFIQNDNNNKKFVDHINKKRHDNRLDNLRWTTKSENCRNKTKKANATSQYTGVSFHTKSNKYKAAARLNGKSKYIGYFSNEIDAGKAYDTFCRANGLYTANFNFKE